MSTSLICHRWAAHRSVFKQLATADMSWLPVTGKGKTVPDNDAPTLPANGKKHSLRSIYPESAGLPIEENEMRSALPLLIASKMTHVISRHCVNFLLSNLSTCSEDWSPCHPDIHICWLFTSISVSQVCPVPVNKIVQIFIPVWFKPTILYADHHFLSSRHLQEHKTYDLWRCECNWSTTPYEISNTWCSCSESFYTGIY